MNDSNTPVVVPRGRLSIRTVRYVRPGDLLRARQSFTNPDVLTKGDHVIVESVGDDGNIVFTNLYRPTIQCGLNPDRFAFVNRPVTRLSAVYAAPVQSLPVGVDREAIARIIRDAVGHYRMCGGMAEIAAEAILSHLEKPHE